MRKLRFDSKRTLKEQSEVLNVSLNTIYRWEHDLSVPRRAVLEKIADIYNVPVQYLLLDGEKDTNDEDRSFDDFENNPESQLLQIYRNLSRENKYKILGYVERLSIESFML